MERINRILEDDRYRRYVLEIEKHESERPFCRHDMSHFLSVSRIAYIMGLESGAGIDKAVYYACGLLHDIGRFVQYETGEDHALVSVRLARPILISAGFGKADVEAVCAAIAKHRKETPDANALESIVYRADKASRPCFSCPSKALCKNDNQKQQPLTY